ncbi:hypothetical protein BDZ89DRAFT_1097602 [Hymenopellis radicata]|nr:hypothetical protein BDZ89DRAFT_1097602 [Hymenopellis radicata]
MHLQRRLPLTRSLVEPHRRNSDGKRRWSDYMSGNFSWRHANAIYAEDSSNEGAMVVYIILGSKTTVSVGTGSVEDWPLYLSIGNLHNSACRGRRNGVVPIGFLSIPKAITTPVVRLCPDGHYRRVIYDLGGYIADYPEQVLLAGVVSGWCPKCTSIALSTSLDTPAGRRTHDGYSLCINNVVNKISFTTSFPRADIHEIITSDLLHQVVKGTYKDHLVEWVQEYLTLTHGKDEAGVSCMMIAVVREFPGLRHFPHGCRFKQWTDDDSKTLMKVFIPAIADCIPPKMVDTLTLLDDMLARFHSLRTVFIETGVRKTISLPRQHSLVHYRRHIEEFGAPNGLCSSITESRHAMAVKDPWRRSSRYRALGQMLLTNQRTDKRNALNMEFATAGLVPPGYTPLADPSDKGAVDVCIRQPSLPELTRRFLYDQLRSDTALPSDEVDISQCPPITSRVYVFHSAVASFYAPSDIAGTRGMKHERIRSTPSWYGHPRRDCALAWFKKHGTRPDPTTGMWIVKPERYPGGRPQLSVIHLLDSLIRAHLISVFGKTKIPRKLKFFQLLDAFKAFFMSVNMQIIT